jgi:hypothetical protein
MITEILVEQERLDLFEDIGAELNYAIDDIKDFSARNTNYSKTINIPGNANNNKVFGHIYNFTSGNNYYVSDPTKKNVGYNFDASKQANCQIFVNKIQVFKGVIRLLEIKIQNGVIEYECAVFGELGGFASAIGNILLEDMTDFDKYNTNWNPTTITNSWNASGVASGVGIVYPLIDYGLCKDGTLDYHLNAFRPAFFVHEILDRIILNSKYTYTSSFFDTPFFKSLIIPNNKANLEEIRDNLLYASCAGFTTTNDVTTVIFGSSSLYLFTLTYGTDFKYTGSSTIIGNVSFYGGVTITTEQNVEIAIYNGATKVLSVIIPSNAGVETFYFLDKIESIALATNDILTVSVITDTTHNPSFNFESNDLTLHFISDSKVPLVASDESFLTMQALLPKGIQQKDFFASICRMFNLYVFEDPQKSTHLLIEPYIEFYRTGAGFLKTSDLGELLLHGETGDTTGLLLLSDPIAESIDWSKKVDYSKDISIKPMSELNARYYDFLYTEDSDYYNDIYNNKFNESYGSRKEDTNFQFATDRQEIKIIFSQSVLVSRSVDTKLCASIFKYNANTEERLDHNIRIMQYKYITGVPNYHIKHATDKSNGNYSGNLTAYGYAGHFDDPTIPSSDINFGVLKETRFTLSNPYPTANLFTAFWTDYLAEITSKDSKLLTCYLYLTIQDIYSLDFANLIYIDGALWRLNKVIDFNPSIPQTTKVELLKVIELTYS